MASCELNKFYGVAHDIAGVDKTSAVRMKDDLLFLPVGGKNHENEELNTPDKTFKWGEYIKRKLNKYFANTNSIYGNLVTLTKDPKGTYVQLEYTKQLSDAIDYKNGIISEEQYLHELEEQNKEFKDRSEEANEKISDEGDVFYQVEDQKPSVNYALKSVDILSSDKGKQIFEKGLKNKWDLNKILTELAIPKEQKELILGLDKTNREDIITDLLANYSYTVEINTAKESKGNLNEGIWRDGKKFEYAGDTYEVKNIGYTPKYFKNNKEISFDEIVEAEEKLLQQTKGTQNTQYYSNLTVPGGTNYTENEIAIPGIEVEERPQGVPEKEGVPELFESNPELANNVYEALGFKQNKITLLDVPENIKELDNPNRTKQVFKFGIKNFGTIEVVLPFNKNEAPNVHWILKTNQNLKQPNVALNAYKELNNYLQSLGFLPLKSDSKNISKGALNIWESLVNNNLAIKIGTSKIGKPIYQFIDNIYNQITPQQKQQAQQLYSQYLDTKDTPEEVGSKQDIEGFKSFIKSNTKTVRKGAITPSIKGHAQFSTENGIGWHRSDNREISFEQLLKTKQIKEVDCG